MIKKIVKYFLKKQNLKVWPVTPHSLSGFDFNEDIKKILKINDPVCFDIGANRGQTVDRLLSVFPGSQIYSFEPSTDSYAGLTERKFGPNVHIYNKAAGSQNIRKEFNNYDQHWLSSFLPLNEEAMPLFNNVYLKNTEIAEMITLDQFVDENKIKKIHLLKSDTQGYDLEVLKGSENCLSGGLIECIYIEINFMKLYKGQSDPFDIIQYLYKFNYHLVDLYEKVRIGYPVGWANALFVLEKNSGNQ
jgi:FkbM family methyltransferase